MGCHLCNLWITNLSNQATLSLLPSDHVYYHQSRNSIVASRPSKSRLPTSLILPSTPEHAPTNPVARDKPPRTEESSDDRPQAETGRASRCGLRSSYPRSDQTVATT